MLNNKSVSISVSDDEPEQLDRFRVRGRRKRKKHGRVSNGGFGRRTIEWLMKFWVVVVLMMAGGLLLFEMSRIVNRPSLEVVVNSEGNKVKRPSLDGVVDSVKSNLNRLDHVTRVVGGVRVNCLDILPDQELQHLEIPKAQESTAPVKKVVYLLENSMPRVGGNNLVYRQLYQDGMRFNLFTGNQTFDQREKSFKVSETAEVHCGFCNENGGFTISNEDKKFMESCNVVVSTCAFGGGDDLYQPIGMSEASLEKVCYVAFWDEVTVEAQESKGNRIGENHFIGKWRVVVVKNLPFSDQRLNGKIPKMLGHRLFPNAKYSIWVDSKSQFRRDPLGVLEALLWRSKSVLAISEHGARSSVYDEAKAVVKKHKATPEEVELQLYQYRLDGLPEDKRFNGKKALSEASVIVREHTPLTNLLMCLWFNEVVRFTSRDQLSFPYVLWRLKVLKNINMFPVCTRKDLVNSMGHIRKAKPLTS
ncbi:hypothetical protein ACFE04_007273 [Oxalis oulophora]